MGRIGKRMPLNGFIGQGSTACETFLLIKSA
jgi:hypothetical protein